MSSTDDVLNGGSGDDLVFGQNGADRRVYNMSQNLGTADFYDAGWGYDTLVLQLTYGELLLASAGGGRLENRLASDVS